MKIKKPLSNSKGQILPLVALTVLVLSMFSFLVWNLGMLEFNRQKMQTAADAAALSAVRARCVVYNVISPLNAAMHGVVMSMPFGLMTHNRPTSRLLNWIERSLTGIYGGFAQTQNNIARGAGGMTIATGLAAARANDAAGATWWYVGQSRSTGLRQRRVRFTTYKIVNVPIIGAIPFPVGQFRSTYYARTYENNFRRAQPRQEMVWTAFKNNDTFASSLIGLRRPARAMANAQAKMYLNARENTSTWIHNGGFPRNRSEGIYGWGWDPPIIPLGAAFDARLVPVTRPPMLAH